MNANTPKKRIYWNRKMNSLFLQLYKEQSCLYDKKHKYYNNRAEKLKAHKSILHEMHTLMPHLRVEDIRARIRGIRAKYAQELDLMEFAETSGKPYESKLWYFEELSFLRKHITHLSSEGKYICSNELSYDDDSESNDGGKSLYEELNVTKKSDALEIIPEKQSHVRVHRRKLKWEPELTEKFIEFFKKHPCLYDNDHEDHADQEKRIEARHQLVHEMEQFVPSISLHDVFVKVKCLRNQYSRELKRKMLAEKSKVQFEPKLWCFEQLSFLNAQQLANEPSEVGDYVDTMAQDMEDTLNKEDVGNVPEHNGVDSNNEANETEFNFENEEEEIECDESLFRSEAHTILEIPRDHVPNDNILFGTKTNETFPTDTCKKDPGGDKLWSDDVLRLYNNYDWLGRLVVSQLEEISPRYRNDFAWDVQCLVRKYVQKSRDENIKDEKSSVTRDSKTSEEINRLILPRSSNISLNISFV